jgi:hypothetical protein
MTSRISRRRAGAFAAAVIALSAAALSVAALSAQAAPAASPAASASHRSDSGPAVHHDRSKPLRDIPGKAVGNPFKQQDPAGEDILPHPPASRLPDPVVQGVASATVAPTPNSFDGMGVGFVGAGGTAFSYSGSPSDDNMAVSATQIVQTVNTQFTVFNKTGTALYGPANINTLFTGFGSYCETTNDGDPVVRYDRAADRWVISQFANVRSTAGPYLQCVAVSQTNDATGAYNRYSFQYADFPDYPKMSVWPDAYYVTYNMFPNNTFAGAKACAMDRASMLAGTAATQQCFDTGSSYGGLLGADQDSTTAPPAGEAELMVASGTSNTSLAYWKFHIDWATPANTTFTGPTSLAVANYSPACNAGTCIPQTGTTTQLDSLADRMMYRLAYRNFGDHESYVVDHSVTAGSSTGMRWYELRNGATGAPTVYQQGTYAPDSAYRWMGSIAQDKNGDIGMGFSVSSSTTHPGLHFTGRLAGDTLGTMTQGEGTFIDGAGSQTTYIDNTGATKPMTRWGDYTSMDVDPADGCTFWYTGQYVPANGSRNWHTRIGSFQLPGCTGTTTQGFTVSDSPASGSVTAGGSATSTVTVTETGTAQNVALSATGLPTGATASFSPASLAASGTSTMTIATSATTPAGTYTVTVTGTGTTPSQSASYSLTVNPVATGGITNGGFETGTFSGWTTTGTTSVVNSGAHSGTYAAQLGSTSGTNGDSSASQTFTVPSGSGTLSFWYNVTCPDTVTYDWATATLKDNTTNTTTTVLAKTCAASSGWTQVSAPVTAGDSYTLTLTSHDDNYAGDPTRTLYDDVALSAAAPPPSNPIVNGGFEAGTFSGWTTTGTTSVVNSGAHSGTYAAQLGSTSASNGDSSASQTFTAAAGNTALSFYYNLTCPDTVTYDWATATLKDNTTNTTTTVLAKTCTASSGWTQVTSTVTAGHSYTLTVTSHDDNYAGDPTRTLYDDVTVS